MVVVMHAKILRHTSAHARALVGALAFSFVPLGCAGTEPVDTQSEEGSVDSRERTAEALSNRPELAQVKVTRQAGAFKRASQAEVEAFLSRRNVDQRAVARTAGEIDALIGEVTSSDPERRRLGLRELHDAVRTMPSLEERRNVGERLRTAQLDAIRTLGPSVVKGARP